MRSRAVWLIRCCSGCCSRRGAPSTGGEPKLVSVRKIWDRGGEHNAFTDLVRFKDRWYCVFREGKDHVSPDGAVRILTSNDGEDWESAALVSITAADLRDPKIAPSPRMGFLCYRPRE